MAGSVLLATFRVGSGGQLEVVNNAAAALFAVPLNELEGRRFLDLIREHEADRARTALETAAHGQAVRFEAFVRRGDGSSLPAAFCLTPGESGAILVTAEDMSDRHAKAHATAAMVSRLTALLDTAPAAIFVKDLEGRYLMANAEFARCVGISSAGVLGSDDFELFPLMTAQESQESDQRVLARRAPVSLEEHVPMADGERTFMVLKFPFLDIQGEPYAIAGIATDITERKEIERRLAENEQRYRSLFTHNSDPVYCFDLDNNMTDVNPAMESLTGFSREELLGRGHLRVTFPGDQPQHETQRNGARHGATNYEIRVRHRDGYPLYWAVTALPIIVDGAVTGIYCVAKDLTERKWMEETHRFLAVAGAALQATLDARAMLGRVAELATAHLCDGCMVFLIDDRTGLECVAEVAGDPDQLPLLAQLRQGELLTDRLEKAVLTGQPQSIRGDSEGLPQLKAGQISCLVAPMMVRGRALGAIVFVAGVRRRRYSAGDTSVVMELAGRAALAVEHSRLFERTRHEAMHDALTGLPNRACFLRRLGEAVEERSAGTIALLFLDLDRFKVVNDSLGHEAGDQLLVQTAQRLQRCVRSTDLVARFGGDEFTILLDGHALPDVITHVAQRVLGEFGAPFRLGEQEVFVTASIGIVRNESSRDPGELLRKADIAMYQAKREGKGRYVIFRPSLDVAGAGLRLESELRRGLEREEFTLHFQPVVDLQTRTVKSMEALVRWHHPERGLLPPADFIPLAEETGLILPLGDWILHEACRQARSWEQLLGLLPFRVSVNLSARQIHQPALAEAVAAVLQETGLRPASLQLEITESVLVRDNDEIDSTLQQLKCQGISLAIDDFGTGYSSLHYLQRLPTDTIKIDRSFVAGLGRSSRDTALVEAVVSIARSLNLTVIAEGIETEAQIASLLTMGCNHGQGYLVSRPLPPENVPEFLTARVQR
ncbi:MAG TPA: EAL domain-containing protein [Symbiobacteriaceae bacterium]|nr:EAL domain-containing protein [Symbiobacteriaceae bacterium]